MTTAEQLAQARRERLGWPGGLVPIRDAATPQPWLNTAPPSAPAEQSRATTVPDVPSPQAPPGYVFIDVTDLERLQRSAGAPEQIRAQQAEQERQSLVASAIQRGAITPHQGRKWMRNLEVEPANGASLAAIPAGTSGVPLTEIGHALQSDHEPAGWF